MTQDIDQERLEKITIDISWQTSNSTVTSDAVVDELVSSLPPAKQKALKTYLGFPSDAQDVIDTWKKRRALMVLEMSDEDIQRQLRSTYLKLAAANLSYDPESDEEQKMMASWQHELNELEKPILGKSDIDSLLEQANERQANENEQANGEQANDSFSLAFFNLILETFALGFLICLLGMTLMMLTFALLLL